jgi:hypothetical protein
VAVERRFERRDFRGERYARSLPSPLGFEGCASLRCAATDRRIAQIGERRHSLSAAARREDDSLRPWVRAISVAEGFLRKPDLTGNGLAAVAPALNDKFYTR